MGNVFGHVFRVMTWGESHGKALGAVIDGCPPGLFLSEADIQSALNRRRPGQSALTTPRSEKDQVTLLSGVHNGKTLGTPINLMIENHDIKTDDYQHLAELYRPGHADFTYAKKYGSPLPSGGGRASARETGARVAAGAIAQKYLKEKANIELLAYVTQVYDVVMPELGYFPDNAAIEASPVRCPDQTFSDLMIKRIQAVQSMGDSCGGIIVGLAKNVPIGLGEPVFDRLEADLAKAMLSIPATKGFEIGSGFEASKKLGSENNDRLIKKDQKIAFASNHAGGVLGGITTGELLNFRVAFKPPSTILKTQQTLSHTETIVDFKGHGRMDPCVLPRAVPIVESMMALVLMDHYLLSRIIL
jgi:chorismate synthase